MQIIYASGISVVQSFRVYGGDFNVRHLLGVVTTSWKSSRQGAKLAKDCWELVAAFDFLFSSVFFLLGVLCALA